VSELSVTSAETSPSLAAIVAAIDPDLPEYRARTSPDGMMTIVFTDLEGSTEMMERLGEDRWLEVMLAHNRLVRECVLVHGGEIVKSQGDGFMIAFGSARAALACAVSLQRVFAHHNEHNPGEQLRMRIGVHTGNIFHTEQDLLGRAVVLAARITGQAEGQQILVSAACREYTERLGLWTYGEPTELRLKGLVASHRVYALDWREG
jgi:class 3 adenylate cyclase